jgi:hypothetical protein
LSIHSRASIAANQFISKGSSDREEESVFQQIHVMISNICTLDAHMVEVLEAIIIQLGDVEAEPII